MQNSTSTALSEQRINPAYQAKNVLGKTKLYMNWGLWNETTVDLDDAAFALIMRIAQLAKLNQNSRLLDVGFGFGDQLLDWGREIKLNKAIGINICPEQTEIARKRIADEGLSKQIDVQVGSANALRFDAESFDVVTAVECAFHFHTREDFFKQASRVLKKGGLFVLADFIGIENPNWRQRFIQWVATHYWGFAPNSFCSEEEYRQALTKAGFEEISIERITNQVLLPGIKYARSRLFAKDLRQRMGWARRFFMILALAFSYILGDPTSGEYILVSAKRKTDL